MKLPKKLSIKAWYKIGFVLVLAGAFYAFYGLYVEASEYMRSKKAPQKQIVQQQPVAPPVFFRFTPPPQQLHRYAVFTMNRSKAKPANAGGNTKISGFDILGVVKRDRLFLVVRTKPAGKIRLIPQGEVVNGGSTVKELTNSSVVILQKDGAEKTHKIFAFKGVTEQTAPNGKKKQDNKKNNRKQTQTNQGRSF